MLINNNKISNSIINRIPSNSVSSDYQQDSQNSISKDTNKNFVQKIKTFFSFSSGSARSVDQSQSSSQSSSPFSTSVLSPSEQVVLSDLSSQRKNKNLRERCSARLQVIKNAFQGQQSLDSTQIVEYTVTPLNFARKPFPQPIPAKKAVRDDIPYEWQPLFRMPIEGSDVSWKDVEQYTQSIKKVFANLNRNQKLDLEGYMYHQHVFKQSNTTLIAEQHQSIIPKLENGFYISSEKGNSDLEQLYCNIGITCLEFAKLCEQQLRHTDLNLEEKDLVIQRLFATYLIKRNSEDSITAERLCKIYDDFILINAFFTFHYDSSKMSVASCMNSFIENGDFSEYIPSSLEGVQSDCTMEEYQQAISNCITETIYNQYAEIQHQAEELLTSYGINQESDCEKFESQLMPIDLLNEGLSSTTLDEQHHLETLNDSESYFIEHKRLFQNILKQRIGIEIQALFNLRIAAQEQITAAVQSKMVQTVSDHLIIELKEKYFHGVEANLNDAQAIIQYFQDRFVPTLEAQHPHLIMTPKLKQDFIKEYFCFNLNIMQHDIENYQQRSALYTVENALAHTVKLHYVRYICLCYLTQLQEKIKQSIQQSLPCNQNDLYQCFCSLKNSKLLEIVYNTDSNKMSMDPETILESDAYLDLLQTNPPLQQAVQKLVTMSRLQQGLTIKSI